MTTWKRGGRRGEIFSEDNDFVCIVQTVCIDKIKITPWLEGEANFRLILQAPQMLAALCSIRDKVECYLQPLADHPSVNRARWEAVRDQAVTAIAAVKGENGDDIG